MKVMIFCYRQTDRQTPHHNIYIITHDHHALGGANLHRHHHDVYPGVAVHEAPHVVERST